MQLCDFRDFLHCLGETLYPLTPVARGLDHDENRGLEVYESGIEQRHGALNYPRFGEPLDSAPAGRFGQANLFADFLRSQRAVALKQTQDLQVDFIHATKSSNSP